MPTATLSPWQSTRALRVGALQWAMQAVGQRRPKTQARPFVQTFHGRSEQIRRSSYSSVWKRSPSSATASVDTGDAQTIGRLWEEYFVGPSQWWDNRVHKRNPRSPDFKHKVTGKALWIDGGCTPAWVK